MSPPVHPRRRRRTGHLHPAVLLAACLLLPAGCGGDPPAPPGPFIIVAEDLSGSAFARNARMANQEVAAALQDARKQHGQVMVLGITGDTAGRRVILLPPELGDFRTTPEGARSPDERDQLLDLQMVEALATYRKERGRATPAEGSDYLGALVVMDQHLAGAGDVPKQVVFIGDGLQDTSELVLSPKEVSADTCREQTVARRRAGNLGRLHGAQVEFVGGGLNPGETNAAQQSNLTACWQAIVTTLGGTTSGAWWQ